MEEKQKIQIDKGRLLTDVITGTIITIISMGVLVAFLIIANPFEKKDVSELDPKSYDTQVKRISEALKKISETYIDTVDIEKLADGAIEGIAKATGDPYTRYMSETEYNDMLTSGTQEYGGVGVHITYDKNSGGIIILGIMPNSPALDAGLQPGDIITKVDDEVVNIDTYSECVDKIKGAEGTTVKLTVFRSNNTFEKTLTRKKIVSNNVESKVLDNNIGYIKILAFENDVARQFSEQYAVLKSKNITGLVIDLRDNPGGLVSETIKIANLLLPKGQVIKLVYKDGSEKVYNSDGKNEIQIPLTVLVNERSASASEILSGAIKDSTKGVLIGTKTYGKGIVQTVDELSTKDGALSITTAKYYTASGIEIHKNGIEPNYTVELPDDVKNSLYIPYEKDTQLQKAIEVIKSKK